MEEIVQKYLDMVEPYVYELVGEFRMEPVIANDAKTKLQMKIDDTLLGAIEEIWPLYSDREWDEDYLEGWYEYCAESCDDLWVWSERETISKMVDGEQVFTARFNADATMGAVEERLRSVIPWWVGSLTGK